MNINIELYKVFYSVAKNGNITRTSQELLISQPAVSKSIKNLEEQLDTTLFIRSKKGVTLTNEGKELYDEIKKAMEIIENAERIVTEENSLESGTLRIGVSKTITQNFLLKYITEFHNKYPNIKIKIDTTPTKLLIDKARNGLVDIIVLNLPYSIPKDFIKKDLIDIHDIFIANNNYKELKNKTISLKDINKYPLIISAKESNTRYYLDDFCYNNGIYLNPEIELASNSLVVDFSENGFGIGVATKEYIQDKLDNNKLFEVKVNPSLPKRHIGYIYLNNKKINKITSEFINLLNKN